MMLCNYNVLILDEPNNHLDLEAVSALARRHAVQGEWRVVKSWFDRCDGTAQSLQDADRSGRPRILHVDEAAEFIMQGVG